MAMSDEDDAVGSASGVAGYKHALKESVRITLKDPLIVVGARIALLTVAEYVLGRSGGPDEEAPFDAGWECGAPSATQTRVGDLFYDVRGLHVG